MVVHALAAFALMPVAGQPYDLAVLTGQSGAWLRWGVPLFDQWKFGFDLSVLAVGSQGLSFVLVHLGLSGAAALAVAWKLPLVLADLLVGAVLVDLGRQLRCRRPGLVPTLWLISPVPLWVSAGHGQVESLTVLAIVLALDLLVRRRPLLAGIVLGLGIGIEYLPALVALIVVFWLYVGAIERREVYRFAAGCVGALAFCFGPPLATYIGRTSLLGGLSYTAAVASNTGQAQGASLAGSSLWAVFDLSPGPFWLLVALSTASVFMAVLIRKARSTGDPSDRRRLGILAAGGLLLCVSLFDPGMLPQFSVLVLGGMCLIALSVDLSPAAIILGPALQLAAGIVFVYGGSFQSYWYDMWVTTGAGRLAVPAKWPGGSVGVPPRGRRRRPRPATRAVPGARSHDSGAPARRPGSLVHRRRRAWHRLFGRLVTAARILAGSWITGAVHAGGFLSPHGGSARHAVDHADLRADRVHLPGGARRARERCPSRAESGRHGAPLL